MPPMKPGRWSVNPQDVEGGWAWRQLRYLLPIWPDEVNGLHEAVGKRSGTVSNLTSITPGVGALGARMEWGAGAVNGDSIRLPRIGFPINGSFHWTMMVLVNVGNYTADEKALFSQVLGDNNWSNAARVRLNNQASPKVQWLDNAAIRGTTTGSITSNGDAIVFASSDGRGVSGSVRIGFVDLTTGVLESLAVDTVNNTEGTEEIMVVGNGLNDESVGVKLYMFAFWERHFGDDEIRRLAMDPYQLIRPRELKLALPSIALYATATGTITNVVDEADTTVDLHLSVDDDPDTPTDTDWINNAITPGSVSAFFPLTDMAANFGNAESASIEVRTRGQDIGGTPLKLFAQLFQSDELTTLSDEVECVTVSSDGVFTNFLAIFTGLNTSAGKAVWDGARVRFRWGL